MRVTRVEIENFKRLESLRVDLSPLDCLVGPNNSGKTTLLQALALFDFCVHHCLTRRNGSLEIRKRTIPPEGFYVLPVSNPMELWTDRTAMAAGRQKVITIRVIFDVNRAVTASVKLDYNRFGIGIESEDESPEWLRMLAEYRMAYLPVFSAFLAQEERRTRAVVEDELARGRVHSVIRNLLLDLKEQGRHEKLLEALRRSFPALVDMQIEFDEVSDRYISVTYQESGKPKGFDVFSAGSGFQQFLYLFGFIHLREPKLVLLDEPDAHLHGTLQSALLDELGRLTQEGRQVLFATHSRELINGVAPENIISLEEDKARRLRVGFDVYDTLDHLGSVDRTQLPVIQAYQRVLILEDQSDRDLLFGFCETCLGPAAWQQVARRLALCYSRGNPCRQPIDRLRQQLQQMISLQGRTLECFVVADRDYEPDPDQLRATLPADHLQWHIWQRTEIENYLLHPEAILRLIRGSQQQLLLDEVSFRNEYQSLLAASREAAHDQLIQAFQHYRHRIDERWDAATMSRKAREYLNQHWETSQLALADAKSIVLPGLKRWLQEHGFGQFSNKSLADILAPEDLPEEVHQLARKILTFSGT